MRMKLKPGGRRWKTDDPYERVMAILGPQDPDQCWIWPRSRQPSGYGQIAVKMPTGKWRPIVVHRITYEGAVGPIPEGRELDHLCRVPACCNPRHVEPVTHRTNVLRGEAPMVLRHHTGLCKSGHPRTPEHGKYREDTGRWRCQTCAREYKRQHWAKMREGKPDLRKVRRPACRRGHTWSESNTEWRRGYRSCRACRKMREERYRAERSA